jgi:hypothetical protein
MANGRSAMVDGAIPAQGMPLGGPDKEVEIEVEEVQLPG